MSRKRRSKRHIKRYNKHVKTRIRRNMYRKKHKKTQRGGLDSLIFYPVTLNSLHRHLI